MGVSARARLLLALSGVILLSADAAFAQCVPTVNAVAPPSVTFTSSVASPEFYFREGVIPTQTLLRGTNPTGVVSGHFDELFTNAEGKDKILRIHLTNGKRQFPASAGQVDCTWLAFWDDIFTRAANHGLYVIPVFDVWADWSTTQAGTQNWDHSFYNAASVICDPTSMDYHAGVTCGPAFDPLELVTANSATQNLWLGWLSTLIQHWRDRPNIIGWEVFSELNLINNGTTRASEADAVDFAEKAADAVRAADTSGRPVMASRAGDVTLWPTLANSPKFEFVQTHPYAEPFGSDLDEFLIDHVRTLRLAYNKPVFIGESGLDGRTPVDNARITLTPSICTGSPQQTCVMSGNANIGINQAIWAGVVSGAMNARMLWFEDGYDLYQPALANLCIYPQYAAKSQCLAGTGLTLRQIYADATAPLGPFLTGVDFAGFAPIAATMGSANITGAALGNANLVLGWVKNVESRAANDWVPPGGTLVGETITVDVPGNSADWLVDFYDPMDPTGTLESQIDADQNPAAGDDITFTLPNITGSKAFKLYPVGPLNVTVDIASNSINMATVRPLFVRVDILGTADFDPSLAVDPATVHFGPAAAPALRSRASDINHDGYSDLRLWFRKSATGFSCRGVDQLGTLTGETMTGRSVSGSDTVRIQGAGLPRCP